MDRRTLPLVLMFLAFAGCQPTVNTGVPGTPVAPQVRILQVAPAVATLDQGLVVSLQAAGDAELVSP